MNNLLINHINTMLGNARSKGQKVDYISFCPQDYKEVASALSFNFSPDESTSGEGMLFGYRFVIRDGASGLKMKNGEFWALPIVVKEGLLTGGIRTLAPVNPIIGNVFIPVEVSISILSPSEKL